MVDFSVYPRSVDFGELPAGVQSDPVWVHLANYSGAGMLPVGDWGVNNHFISKRPTLQRLSTASVTLVNTTPPPSGSSLFVVKHGQYIFDNSNTKGLRVYTMDSAKAMSHVSTRSGLIGNGQMIHDGRFLYIPHSTNGLYIVKIDPFGNAILKSVVMAGITGPNGIDHNGEFVVMCDNQNLTVLKVDHNGQATVTDQKAHPGGIEVFARKDVVFVISLTIFPDDKRVQAYKLDAAGRLTVGDHHSFSNAPEHITGDDDFIYVVEDKADDLHSLSYDIDSDTLTLEDTVSIGSAVDVEQAFFDGAYVLLAQNSAFTTWSVDRSDGSLAKVTTINDSCMSLWSDGVDLITARSITGLSVYTFGNSRIRFPVYYTPLGYDEHYGEMSVQDVEIKLKGKSPANIDPYIIAGSESLRLEADRTWSQIAFDFYGSFDRVQDVKDFNTLIPAEIKARLYVPKGAIIQKPVDTETELSSIGAASWRR